jgi:hypothetical protein
VHPGCSPVFTQLDFGSSLLRNPPWLGRPCIIGGYVVGAVVTAARCAFKASTRPTAFSRLHGFDLAIISLLDVVFVVLWTLLVVVVAISLPLGALPQLMRTFVEMTKKPPEA